MMPSIDILHISPNIYEVLYSTMICHPGGDVYYLNRKYSISLNRGLLFFKNAILRKYHVFASMFEDNLFNMDLLVKKRLNL